jgi:hypothetical protein
VSCVVHHDAVVDDRISLAKEKLRQVKARVIVQKDHLVAARHIAGSAAVAPFGR